jgi:putative ABC transport system substrate-binding protein
MKTRRDFVIGGSVGLCALVVPLVSLAQKKPATIPRVGAIFAANAPATAHFNEAFVSGLREHGYTEGRNVIVERRYGESRVERVAEIAAELVRGKIDVIVAGTDGTIAAVKRATQTIPIVMVGSTDPVGTGFVESLARPGGNLTGLSTMSPELSGKQVELLKEVVPGLSRMAFIWNPDVRGAMYDYKATAEAARTLRLQVQSVEMNRAEELERAFSAITSQRAQGLIVQTPNPATYANRSQIVGLAQQHRLPAVFGEIEFAEAGGLISYGSNAAERWRRAAAFVDKILKGARPAQLPVEQPTKFELVVNMRTAKALGLTIPQTILVRADRVIE